MNYQEFESWFKGQMLPVIYQEYEQYRGIDIPARREAWNDTIDTMVRYGDLPRHAVDWTCPFVDHG